MFGCKGIAFLLMRETSKEKFGPGFCPLGLENCSGITDSGTLPLGPDGGWIQKYKVCAERCQRICEERKSEFEAVAKNALAFEL